MSQRKWVLYWIITGLLLVIGMSFPLKKPAHKITQHEPPQAEAVSLSMPQSSSTKRPGVSAVSNTAKTEPKRSEGLTPASPEEVKKIRQEIKVGLAGLYTAEKAYQADYGRFSTDLIAMGWEPMESKSNVKFGFIRAFNPKKLTDRESPRVMDSDILRDEMRSQGRVPFEVGVRGQDIDLERYASYCQKDCTADETHFEIIASTNLGYGKPEIWILNENKEIKQLSDGTR